MTLPYSGQISLGQVNDELVRPHTQSISLGSSSPRGLAGKPTGPIKLSDLYAKSRINVMYFPSNGEFIIPPGITYIDFCLVAGGGGAGNVYGAAEGAAGGGAGGVLIATNVPVTAGQKLVFAVGAGGAAGGYAGGAAVGYNASSGKNSSLRIWETTSPYAVRGSYEVYGGGPGGVNQIIDPSGESEYIWTVIGQAGGSCGGNSGWYHDDDPVYNPFPAFINSPSNSSSATYLSLGHQGGDSDEDVYSGGGGGAAGPASGPTAGNGVYYIGSYVGAGGPGGRSGADADPAPGGWGAGGRGGYTSYPGTQGIFILKLTYS